MNDGIMLGELLMFHVLPVVMSMISRKKNSFFRDENKNGNFFKIIKEILEVLER